MAENGAGISSKNKDLAGVYNKCIVPLLLSTDVMCLGFSALDKKVTFFSLPCIHQKKREYCTYGVQKYVAVGRSQN